jgi:ATP-dependent helicase HrpA
LPRFIKGIQVRLARLLNAGLKKDEAGMAVVAPLERAYRERLEKHRKAGVVDDALVTYRWMLEEFRVSTFAQELKTSVPVSGKRLGEVWATVKS